MAKVETLDQFLARGGQIQRVTGHVPRIQQNYNNRTYRNVPKEERPKLQAWRAKRIVGGGNG